MYGNYTEVKKREEIFHPLNVTKQWSTVGQKEDICNEVKTEKIQTGIAVKRLVLRKNVKIL